MLIEIQVIIIGKNGDELIEKLSYKLQFIDSARFMAGSLSNLLNNLSEGIQGIKCKYGHNNRKCETCRIKYRNCECSLESTNFKNDLIEYKCLCYNKNY